MRLGLKIVFSLLIIIIATIISLPFIIDPNDYKDEIAQQVKQHTGRTLHIPGDIQLSVFPWLGLELGEVKLENAAGFKPKYFAQVSKLDVRIQFWPLLKGNIQVGHVILNGVHINLQRNKQGITNWDDLTSQTQTATPAEQKTEPTPTTPGSKTESTTTKKISSGTSPLASLAALSIEGVKIEDAHLHWLDQTTNQDARIEKIQLTLGKVSLTEKIPLQLSFNFNSKEPEIQSHLRLQTDIQLNLGTQTYRLSNLSIAPNIRTELVPGMQLNGNIQINTINTNLAQQYIELKKINTQLSYQLKEPEIKGELNLNTDTHLNLASQQYTLHNLVIHNTATSNLIPGNNNQAQINSPKLQLDLTKEIFNAADLTIKTYNLDAALRIRASQLLSQPNYAIKLSTSEFNLKALLKQLKLEQSLPQMADNTAMHKVKLSSNIIGDTNQISLSALSLQLDQTQLQGVFSVKNFQQPAIRYQLTVNDIDIDRYLPPAAKKQTTSNNQGTPTNTKPATSNDKGRSADSTPANTAALPVDLLRSLDIDGLLKVNKLKVMNLKSEKIQLGTQAKQGLLTLNPIKASLYQGNIDATAKLDVRSQTAKIRIQETLKGVQIGPLLKDFMGDDMVRGQANISANIQTQTIDPVRMRKTLNGTAKMYIADGELKNFDVEQLNTNLKTIKEDIKAIFSNLNNLGEAKKHLDRIQDKWKAIQNESTGKSTYFSKLSASAQIKNGLIDNNDLRMDFPYGRARGEGKVDLVKENMDYTAYVKLTSKVQVKNGKSYEQLDREPIKIYLKGPFSDITPKPDYSGYINAYFKRELNNAEARLKAKAKEKLEQEKQKLKQKYEQEKKAKEKELKDKAKKELEEKAKETLQKLFKF